MPHRRLAQMNQTPVAPQRHRLGQSPLRETGTPSSGWPTAITEGVKPSARAGAAVVSDTAAARSTPSRSASTNGARSNALGR